MKYTDDMMMNRNDNLTERYARTPPPHGFPVPGILRCLQAPAALVIKEIADCGMPRSTPI